MKKKQIDAIKKLLSIPINIVLVAHKNPDGDAIGSTLAMQHYLNQKGHNARTVLPNDVPDFLHWLPGLETVLKYDKQNKQSKTVLDASEVMFVLDFNAFHRVGDDMQIALESFLGTFIMIDHHQQPDLISEFIYSDTSICSTCQMVYHFIEMMGDLEFVNENVATCLYTGIMTDTGSFRFPSTTSTTHKVIGDLIERGADNAKIHDVVFNTSSYSRLQLTGVALTNLKILPEYHTAYISLSQEELNRCNYKKGDTEGLVNYGLSVKGIYFAVIFIEDLEQKIIKISFRSKGKFSVNQFSRKHFNGGGHDNAAGGKTIISLSDSIKGFLEILKDYKNELAISYEN